KRSTLLRQRCLQRLYFCRGRAEIGSHLIEALLSRGARWRKLFGSPQVELDAIASRLGVGKVGFRLGNLGLLGPRLYVCQLLLNLLKLSRRLISGSSVRGFVLGEQRALRCDFVATRN